MFMFLHKIATFWISAKGLMEMKPRPWPMRKSANLPAVALNMSSQAPSAAD